MTRSFLARIHRDERGFLSPIILFMTIALAYMIIWILNTGQLVYDKQRTQDTADAAALVHADWSARYLNIMAMNNVASSQATVILATSTAFQLTTAELAVRAGIIAAKLVEFSTEEGLGGGPLFLPLCMDYEPIPIIGPIIYAACAGFQGIRGFGAARALAYVGITEVKYNPLGLIAKSKEIIDAMNQMNKYLVDSFPERVGNEALNLVRMDDADHLVFHPACKDGATCKRSQEGQGGDLPVDTSKLKGAVAYAEMCMAMEDGTKSFGPISMRGEYSKRGFPDGKGPLTAGGVDGRHIRDFVNDESEIDVELPFFYTWYEAFGPGYRTSIPVKALIEQFNPDLGFFGGLLIDGAMFLLKETTGLDFGFFNPFQYPIDSPPRYEDAQSKNENDFTRKFDKIWGQVCGVGGGIAGAIGILPQPYWLKGREVYAFDPVTTRATGDQLKPFRALAVVSRSPRARLQPKKFTDKTAAFAYAESWVHNYTAFDLYTQDWLASLAPTSLANDVTALSQTVKQSPVADSYKALTGAFDKGGSNAWSVVNTH